MSNLNISDFVAIHRQPVLQYADWMIISNLAKAEDVSGCFETWSLEDFLGLTVYLFVTTQSQSAREQLSQLLPKFGSAAVLPLLKILCRQETFVERNIPALAQRSLCAMSPYPLVIGLNQVLELKPQEDLRGVTLQTLRQCLQACESSTCLVLSQLLSAANRQLVSEAMVSQLPTTGAASGKPHEYGSAVAVLEHRVVQRV